MSQFVFEDEAPQLATPPAGRFVFDDGPSGPGLGESFARGFMGSIPALISMALAKRGVVAQAGEILPTEAPPPPAEIAAAARRFEEDLAPKGEPTFRETVASGLGTVTGDLPAYVAGGYGAARLAKPVLSKVPPLLAKVAGRLAGSVGAFEAPAAIREAAIQAGEGEFVPERFAKELGIGGATGGAVGVASLIPNPLLRVPAEVVAMVGAESYLRQGRLPTFKELLEGGVTIAVLQAAFRLAGIAFPGGERAGGPVRGAESPDFKGAMAEAKPAVRPIPGIIREAVAGERPGEALRAPTIAPEPPATPPVAVQPGEAQPAQVAPRTEPVPATTAPAPSPLGVGDPVVYRPKLSDNPITGAITHINPDGTVNIRARTGGVVRKIPPEKVTPLLTPDEVGLDSQRTGNRVALGADDKAILGEMRQTISDMGGEVGQRIFLEGGEVGRGGDVTVKGFKTSKPSWMEIPDKPGEYYEYKEVVKALQSLRQGKWPQTAKQERIATQLLQEVRFDAENEKARLAGWERQAMESETAPTPQPTRDQSIQDAFFAEVDRLAAEEQSASGTATKGESKVQEGPPQYGFSPGTSESVVIPSRVAPDAVLRSVVGMEARQKVGEPRSEMDYQAWEDRLRAEAKRLYAKIEARNTGKAPDASYGVTKGPLRWDYAERELARRKRLGLPSTIEEARAALDKSKAAIQTAQREAETVPPAARGAETPEGTRTALPPETPRPAGQAEGKVEEAPRLYQIPKEPTGTTLGSLGGVFQEAAGFLPESVRNLPAAYRAKVQKGIDYITAKMPKVLKEARGLGQGYVDILHDRGATLANYMERGIELSGKIHHGLTETERSRVDQVIRGGITTNPVIEKLVAPLRALIDELQAKLIKYGYFTPEDVQMFRERFTSHPEYLRRLYSSKLVAPDQPILAGETTGPVARGVKSEALMMRGDIQHIKLPLMGGEPLVGKDRADFLQPWLKKGYRLMGTEGDTATLFRDIPEVLRKAMGEIRGQPGFVAARTIAEQARIVANHEFLDAVRSNPEFTRRGPGNLEPTLRYEAPTISDTELASGEWVQLRGDKKKWGPIADHYVRRDVALELESSVRLRADWEKVIGRLVGMWKYGKVIVNPAAMGRNVISSAILADFGGLHPWMVDEWAKGAADFAKQSGLWNEAKQMGLFRSNFASNEIAGLAEGLARSNSSNAILRVLDGMHEIVEATGRKTGIRPAALYGTIENFYRYNLYRYGREGLGLTPVEARRYAVKYAIDYEVVSPAVAALRGTGGGWAAPLFALGGSPFITFSAKAIPLTLETAALHPLRVGKYLALIYGVSKLAGAQIGQREEETAAQREIGSLNPLRYALLPFRDKDGRAQYYDLGYTLPFGDLIEALDAAVGGQGRRANVAFLPVVGHPTFAVAEAILNKSGFTGKELSEPSDTAMQSVMKRVNHIYSSWMPSLAPPALGLEKGGYAYEDLRRAFSSPPETDFLGRTRSPAAAILANVAGLRARGVTTSELANFKARQYDEMFKALDKDLIMVATRYRNNPEEATRRIAELKQRYMEIAKEAKELFGLIPKGESPPGQSPVSPQSSIPKPIHQALPYTRLTDPTERVMRKYGLA